MFKTIKSFQSADSSAVLRSVIALIFCKLKWFLSCTSQKSCAKRGWHVPPWIFRPCVQPRSMIDAHPLVFIPNKLLLAVFLQTQKASCVPGDFSLERQVCFPRRLYKASNVEYGKSFKECLANQSLIITPY